MPFSKACQRNCSGAARYHVSAGESRTSVCGRHLTRSVDMVIKLEREAGRPTRSVVVSQSCEEVGTVAADTTPRRYDVYVRVNDYDVTRTAELASGIVADYEDDELIGVEVLSASVVEIDGVAQRPIINQAQMREFAAHLWDEVEETEWDKQTPEDQGAYKHALIRCARAAGIEVSDA